MPRQDVPYGGAICRLKERIAEIWDKLGEKLHSVNGVTGDAAGNVEIVSGDAAVVITNDQVNHQIEVALDSSQLPAAAVSSVNGQTGAVVLDATDIKTTNNVPIQTKIVALEGATQTALNNVNAEAQNRQNADATLQGNINAVQASIPGAAATAVANDPTVAQLATDVPNKLDKITSGSTLKAYTHTGATQGETPISSGTDANSIGLRDANGRMQGADPASGATDKTFTTANWISQTGAGRPNNLIHNGGDETVDGRKDYQFAPYCKYVNRIAINTDWWKLWTMDTTSATNLRFWFVVCNGSSFMRLYATISANGLTASLEKRGAAEYSNTYFLLTVKDNIATLWVRPRFNTSRIFGYVENETNVNYQRYSYWSVSNETSQYTQPVAADYDTYVVATEVAL